MGAIGSLVLAAAGTVLLITIAFLLRFKAAGRFDHADDAMDRAGLARDTGAPAAMSLDGAVVLVATGPGRLTLIEAVGDKAVSRQLSPDDVQAGTGGVAIIASGGLGRPSRMMRFDGFALAAVLAPHLDAVQPPAAS
jgi:hypothetical protein